ncbi:MAG TPA: hypothetical protein VGL74_01125 [Terriglobales bacterium]
MPPNDQSWVTGAGRAGGRRCTAGAKGLSPTAHEEPRAAQARSATDGGGITERNN